jgi:hypothetical protein
METRIDVGELKTPQDVEKLKSTLSRMESNNAINSYVYFVIPDDALAIGTDKIGRIYIDFIGTIVEIQASVKTAPVGATLICDINKNGTTIWSTQGNRITIAAGEYTATQTAFNTTEVVVGDYFTIDLDQVGSSTPGGKLVVRLKIERGLA